MLLHAAHRSSQLREGLEAIARACPIIREVRGRGLMLGLEFHELSPALLANFKGFSSSTASLWLVPRQDDLLRTIPALYVQSNLLHEHAVYTQVARSNPRVLRVQPPLIVSGVQVERFLEALEATCAEWALIRQLRGRDPEQDGRRDETEVTPSSSLSAFDQSLWSRPCLLRMIPVRG